MTDHIDTAQERKKLAALEESLCTCGAGHGSREGHTPWCSVTDGCDLSHRLLDALDAERARAERAEGERDQALARLAVAYGAIADKVHRYGQGGPHVIRHHLTALANSIRNLTPDDAKAALQRVPEGREIARRSWADVQSEARAALNGEGET